ncbi:MAG TPA: hypothetical protein VGH27_28945 [Streptosporangiaceae bacterium]|jgi:hypothetical protein
MSFDLAIWRYDGNGITADEAGRIYSDLCSRPFESFVPGPEMAEFVAQVVERFRTAQGTSETPWAVAPDIGSDCVLMPIQSAVSGELFPIIRELASERRLVVFDPQRSLVYQPEPASVSSQTMTLKSADGSVVVNPSRGVIESAVRKLSAADWFVILERSDSYYLQAGYGDRAGAPKDRYVIEYRDGSPDAHRRAFTQNIEDIIAVFLDYLQGGTEWISRFTWSPVG